MTKVKLWISDIDGTIMNYDGSYTKRMEKLIKKINSSENKFVLATGRMFMGADFVAKKFDISAPVVCYQGAMVRDKDKVLWCSPLKVDIVREVIEYLRGKNIHTHVYNNDVLYVEDDNKKIMSDYCDNRGTTYQVVKSFDDIELGVVPKLLAVILDAELMKEVREYLSEKYKGVLTIVQSSKIYLEINDKNASKGAALDFLKEYWNLSDDEVVASGDQDNDIDLLKHAGIRVCVGNNSPALKEIAQYHCKDVQSDELVDLIEGLML